MDLYKEIFANINREIQKILSLVEMDSYEALQKIKAILADNHLSDEECFLRIEEIVRVFESLGSGCGGRHDFG